MRTVPVEMLGRKIDCRGYFCSECRGGLGQEMPKPRFIFYVMATDKCNGHCQFCDIRDKYLHKQEANPDTQKLGIVLTDLYKRDLISKISVTGGEPLLNHRRTETLLKAIFAVNPRAKVDITTNGTLLPKLELMPHANRLATIHISRHHHGDFLNSRIFGYKTASTEELKSVARMFPGKVSLNCCLTDGAVDSAGEVERFLDWAAEIESLKSAGFISLMPKNDYCLENKIDEQDILKWIDQDRYNYGHEGLFDTDICECKLWHRVSKNYKPITAFWWKVRRLNIPYCRQLMYTADNRLVVNFNEIAEILI